MNKENFRVLIVDDEKSFLLLMTKILAGEGYKVKGLTDPEDVLKVLDSFEPNLIISDLKMPKMDGVRLMEVVRKSSAVDFIMVTAFATVETAVMAMKRGAVDYITKPLKDPDQLRIAVAKVFERQELLSENALLKSALFKDVPSLDIVFAGMESVLKEVKDVAPTDATVMLYGETGTGKTLSGQNSASPERKEGTFRGYQLRRYSRNPARVGALWSREGCIHGRTGSEKG